VEAALPQALFNHKHHQIFLILRRPPAVFFVIMNGEIQILEVLSVLFSAAAFLASLLFRKHLPRYCRPILILTVIAFLVDAISLILACWEIYIPGIIHVYGILEFILITWFYKEFFRNRVFTIAVYFFIAGFIALGIIDYYNKSISNVKLHMNSIEAILLIAFSFYLFLYVMKNQVTNNLVAETFFWINCAIMLYFAGNFVPFLLINILSLKQIGLMWEFLHNSLNILYNIILILGFWKTRTQTRYL
jgi:hypothetical protein